MQVALKKVRYGLVIHTFSLKLPKEKKIDLYKASKQLTDLNPRYRPEETGIYGMFVTFKKITFCVYENGTLCVYGTKKTKQKKELIQQLWHQRLRFFLV